MYPIFRFSKEMLLHGRRDTLGLFETHISSHICWPWDVDPWFELNNGRTLTLYDLGRLPMVKRTGLLDTVKENGWGIAVAGASIRYRQRVKAFMGFTMHSQVLGWDHRFLYFEQSMWRAAQATSAILCRMAVTDKDGIVLPARLTEAMGIAPTSPPLPEYVHAWINAEAKRPWPPKPSSLFI